MQQQIPACQLGASLKSLRGRNDSSFLKCPPKSTLIIKEQEAVDKITNELKKEKYIVTDIDTKQIQKNPFPPFITSTLQRSGANVFGYAVKKVMKIAQELYEGVEIGEEGPVGLITYMRTDSTRISKEAQDESKEYILKNFGDDYYPSEPRIFKSKKKNVQDAHEAIRPTSIFRTPGSMKKHQIGRAHV